MRLPRVPISAIAFIGRLNNEAVEVSDGNGSKALRSTTLLF